MFTQKNEKKSLLVGAFVCASIIAAIPMSANAHGGHDHGRAKPPAKCPVVGIRATRQFIKKASYTCFKKETDVSSLGYNKTVVAMTKQSDRAPAETPIPSACKFVAIPSFQTYYPKGKLRCFPTVAKAKKAKYVQLTVPTPTPTPTATPLPPGFEPSAPTPTPTVPGAPLPSKGVINYTFTLSPYKPGSGLSGACTATLNDTHTVLDATCDHNVVGAIEAHLHVIPHNEKTCEIVNPGQHFTLHCPLNAMFTEGVEAGNGLIAVHTAEGGTGVAVEGYVRN